MEQAQDETKTASRVEPRVEVFGEDVSVWRRKRNGGGIFLGILLLLVGGLLLLNNFGILPADFWYMFWPLFLILLGARFMLGNSLAARIILLALIVGAFVLIILYGNHVAAGFSLHNLTPNY